MKVEIAIIRLLQVPKKLTNRSQLSYMRLQPSTDTVIQAMMLLDAVLTGSLSRHHFSPWLRPPFEGSSKHLVLRRMAKGVGHFALGWVCLCLSHFCIMGFLGSSLGFDFGFVLQNVEDLVWT